MTNEIPVCGTNSQICPYTEPIPISEFVKTLDPAEGIGVPPKVVYFQINDWNPDEEDIRFLDTIDAQGDVKEWAKAERLCINIDTYDMSVNYWVTSTKDWLTENYPELLEKAHELPEESCWLYDDDWKFFMKYTPENYGFWGINEDNYEQHKSRLVE